MTATHLELRHHELRKSRITLVDGNQTGNPRSVNAGLSARASANVYGGLASPTA